MKEIIKELKADYQRDPGGFISDVVSVVLLVAFGAAQLLILLSL